MTESWYRISSLAEKGSKEIFQGKVTLLDKSSHLEFKKKKKKREVINKKELFPEKIWFSTGLINRLVCVSNKLKYTVETLKSLTREKID